MSDALAEKRKLVWILFFDIASVVIVIYSSLWLYCTHLFLTLSYSSYFNVIFYITPGSGAVEPMEEDDD